MSEFNHALNLTHDGTLILRIPKGYEVDKVVVEEMGMENSKKFVHMPADISDYCDELWDKAYERGKAEGQAEIIRCKDCKNYYFADNRVPSEQSWVCDAWGIDQTAHMGYCFKAERKEE